MFSNKRTRGKRDLTHIFFGCLRYTITGLGMVSIALTSIMIYKELLQLPLLQVKKIQVEGCVNHTPSEILDIADIRPQVNLLALNLKQICRQLESSPWIEKAQVKRTFPDQLYLKISERKPAALINLYSSITNRYSFILEVDGQVKEMTRGELSVYVRSSDPALREAAYKELNRVYAEDAAILGQLLHHALLILHLN